MVSDAALALTGLAYTWPGKAPFRLEVPSLTLAQGEHAVLLGASGSGKSTLLSLICGILVPESGSISLAGRDLTGLSNAKRDRLRAEEIGVIFQQFNLLPFASPLENILLPLFFSRRRAARAGVPRAAALALTEALGLPEDLITSARATELSVGQQQRVAVARALIGKPSLILADEPTSALDATAQSAFLDLLFTETRAAGSTLIMVTHDARLTDRFDRVIDLEEIATVTRGAAA
ncbi:MAG: ATP-binding cassette domain-containing protein [Pseudomonadota bacterium]